MKKSLLYSIAFTCVIPASSQCLLYPVTLSERVALAECIVEGEVISKKSFWGIHQQRIFTTHLVEVTKVFKGTVIMERLQLITQGGRVGDQEWVVQPSLTLALGDRGIFLLNRSPYALPYASELQWISAAGPQGFIKYDNAAGHAHDPFFTYPHKDQDLYPAIEAQTGRSYLKVRPLTPRAQQTFSLRMTPTIGSMAPTSVVAGADQTIILTGSHFETYDGGTNSTVFMANPNDGGATFEAVDASEIVSWTDTEIELHVPSQAATGPIQVRNASNQTGTSSASITVQYSIIQTQQEPIYLRDDNGGGGYTVYYSTNTDDGGVSFQGSAAAAGFENALDTWACATGLNIQGGGSTATNAVSPNTAPNIIMFDNDADPLPPGVLGRAYSGMGTCDGGATWSLNGFDVVFRREGTGGIQWNYGPGPTPTSCVGGCVYDFQTISLHELGHVHTIGHVNAPGRYHALPDQ